MGGSTQKSTSKIDQTTKPLDFTIPGLENISGQVSGLLNTSVNPTDAEKGALSNITNITGQFQPQLTGVLNKFLNAEGVNSNAGNIQGALSTLNSSLQPIASGQFLNPESNPYLQEIVKLTNDRIRNQIGGHFSNAGRSISPAHFQALARGLGENTSQLYYQNYNDERNRQFGALSQLLSGNIQGGQALDAGALNQLNTLSAGASLLPIGYQDQIAALKEQEALRGIPTNQLGALSSILTPVASLGGTQKGTTQTTTKNSGNPLQTALGVGLGVAGLATGNPMLASQGFGGALGGGSQPVQVAASPYYTSIGQGYSPKPSGTLGNDISYTDLLFGGV